MPGGGRDARSQTRRDEGALYTARASASGAKQLGVVISGRFRSAFLVFFVIFRLFENVLQVMGCIDLDQDRRVNETRSPEIVWK